MDIVIIGTGNTAAVLGRKLKKAGHRIVQVAGRRMASAKFLADEWEADATDTWPSISTGADLYLIAVADGAIATVAAALPLAGQTIVHTAASVSVHVLRDKTANYGVLYPLQSLKKEAVQLPAIPFLIDASNDKTKSLLRALAQSIGTEVAEADDVTRVKTHLAAVVVNNFTNHLYSLAEQYCHGEGLSFSLLLPLIAETVSRMGDLSPSRLQTGPAVRGDVATVEKHLALLDQHPPLQALYRQLSESIRQASLRQDGAGC